MRPLARERELKLSAPPTFRLPSFESLGLTLRDRAEKRLVTTYFDTPDLRLARWEVTLRYRAGEGWTVKLPGGAAEGVVTREEVDFPGPAGRPPAAAMSLLRGLLRRDEPEPVARLRTVRRIHELADEGGQVAEIDDDEVSVIDGRRLAARFRQLEVELAQRAPDDLLTGIRLLLTQLGTAPDPVAKAVRALGPKAEGPPEAAPQPVLASDPAGAAVAAAIATATGRLLRNDPGVRLGDDPESVHQARVATRRLRADLRTFKDLLDPSWAGGIRAELSWLGGALGAVRDAEVMRDGLRALAQRLPAEDRAAAIRVAARLDRTRDEARRRLLAGLNSDRYLDLVESLLLAGREPLLTGAAAAPARDVLPGLVEANWRRLRRAVRGLAAEPPDESLHEVRIFAKRLRYAAEAVGIGLGGYDKLAKEAAGLQDVLGRHQDAVVLQDWLRQQRAGLSSAQGFAAGELWGLAGGEARGARREWRAAWKSLRKRALADL